MIHLDILGLEHGLLSTHYSVFNLSSHCLVLVLILGKHIALLVLLLAERVGLAVTTDLAVERQFFVIINLLARLLSSALLHLVAGGGLMVMAMVDLVMVRLLAMEANGTLFVVTGSGFVLVVVLLAMEANGALFVVTGSGLVLVVVFLAMEANGTLLMLTRTGLMLVMIFLAVEVNGALFMVARSGLVMRVAGLLAMKGQSTLALTVVAMIGLVMVMVRRLLVV